MTQRRMIPPGSPLHVDKPLLDPHAAARKSP